MTEIRDHVSLRPYNTFGVDAHCDFFAAVSSAAEFTTLTREPLYQRNEKLVIGGGSNLLLTKDFHGLVVHNRIEGIHIDRSGSNEAIVTAGAGERWHPFVLRMLDEELYGLENLSLIPGCVGASPMQNIGAYGVEIKDVFHSLEAFDMATGERRVFTAAECEFGYRESVFKRQLRNRYLIGSVSFRLSTAPAVKTGYGAIQAELTAAGIAHPTPRDVSNAVIRIRSSKLPDPAVTGNAGSFFKNPEVPADKQRALVSEFPGLVSYPLDNGNFKLAAGWLIEQCGLKGYSMDGAAVHDKQALVIVNKGNATGAAIYALSEHVLQTVRAKFGVELEREVNIL